MADTYATTSLVLSLSRCVVQQRERTQFEATGNVHMIHCWTCESGECGLVVGCTEWKRYIKLIYERSLPEMCFAFFYSIFFPFFSASLLFFRRWLRLPLMRWKTPSSLIAAAAILVTQLMNHLRERNCLKRTTRCQRRRMSAKMRMKWQPQLFIAHYNLEWDGWWCLWLYTNPPENRLLAFNYAKLSLQPCIESETYLLGRDDSVFV